MGNGGAPGHRKGRPARWEASREWWKCGASISGRASREQHQMWGVELISQQIGVSGSMRSQSATRQLGEDISAPRPPRHRAPSSLPGRATAGFCWADRRHAQEGLKRPVRGAQALRHQATRPQWGSRQADWRMKSRPPQPLGMGKSICPIREAQSEWKTNDCP